MAIDTSAKAGPHDENRRVSDTLGVATPGYRIVKRVGRGGMATVYLAVQEMLERTVALKVLTRDLLADPDCETRFLNEGKIIAQFSHPNIVTVFDIGIFDGRYFLAMEYLPGGTLVERIQAGLSQDEVLRILTEVAQALDHAHARGILHRDVKPGNILFRENGACVLSDFGIARTMLPGSSQLTRVGFTVGTPDYMSPEQARSVPLDQRSDLYSLGVVFYEMATGQPPYRGADAFATARLHVEGEVPRLPAEYGRYQAILDRLMAKDPAQRFASAVELIAAIEHTKADQGTRIMAGEQSIPHLGHAPRTSRPGVTSAGQGSAGGRAGQPRRRLSKVIIGASLAVLIAGLLAGTGYWWSIHRTSADSAVAPVEKDIDVRVESEQAARRRLQAQVDSIIRQVDCGALGRELAPDGSVRLTGYATERGLAMVEASLGTLDGVRQVDSAAAAYPLPLCRMIRALEPFLMSGQASPHGGVSLRLNSDRGVFREAEYLEMRIEVARPGDNHLQVDYVDGEGTVVHIFPLPGRPDQSPVEAGDVILLGSGDGGPRFEIAPPHGKNMIVALLTRQPLFATQRPQAESVEAYLPELRRRLDEQTARFGDDAVSVKREVFETRE